MVLDGRPPGISVTVRGTPKKRVTIISTDWVNFPPYKLIGHTVTRLLDPGNEEHAPEVAPFGSGKVYRFKDGKSAGTYSNTASTSRVRPDYLQAGGYIAEPGIDSYVEDLAATERWQRENTMRITFKGLTYRPACFGGRGKLLTTTSPTQAPTLAVETYAFRGLPEELQGWEYEDIETPEQMAFLQ